MLFPDVRLNKRKKKTIKDKNNIGPLALHEVIVLDHQGKKMSDDSEVIGYFLLAKEQT